MDSQTNFYLDRLKPLVGGKITALARSGHTDVPYEHEFFGLVIQLPDGKTKTLILLSDDEGNGPGSFELIDAE